MKEKKILLYTVDTNYLPMIYSKFKNGVSIQIAQIDNSVRLERQIKETNINVVILSPTSINKLLLSKAYGLSIESPENTLLLYRGIEGGIRFSLEDYLVAMEFAGHLQKRGGVCVMQSISRLVWNIVKKVKVRKNVLFTNRDFFEEFSDFLETNYKEQYVEGRCLIQLSYKILKRNLIEKDISTKQ